MTVEDIKGMMGTVVDKDWKSFVFKKPVESTIDVPASFDAK